MFFFPLLYQHLMHSDSISATNAPGHISTFLCFQLPAQVLQAFQTFACPSTPIETSMDGIEGDQRRAMGPPGKVFHEMLVSLRKKRLLARRLLTVGLVSCRQSRQTSPVGRIDIDRRPDQLSFLRLFDFCLTFVSC